MRQVNHGAEEVAPPLRCVRLGCRRGSPEAWRYRCSEPVTGISTGLSVPS